MKYKIQVIDREHQKIEAVVGDNLNEYQVEQLLKQTELLVDTEKYELKVINAF